MVKKVLVAGVLGIFLLGLVTAAWFFDYDKSIEGQVLKTGKKLDVVLDPSNFTLNTTTGNLTNSQNLTLNNKKQNKSMELSLIINKTLTEPECPDYSNDCSVWFGWTNGTELSHGIYFTMFKDMNYYNLKTTCVEFSCGQNISIKVMMT